MSGKVTKHDVGKRVMVEKKGEVFVALLCSLRTPPTRSLTPPSFFVVICVDDFQKKRKVSH